MIIIKNWNISIFFRGSSSSSSSLFRGGDGVSSLDYQAMIDQGMRFLKFSPSYCYKFSILSALVYYHKVFFCIFSSMLFCPRSRLGGGDELLAVSAAVLWVLHPLRHGRLRPPDPHPHHPRGPHSHRLVWDWRLGLAAQTTSKRLSMFFWVTMIFF